MVSKDIQQSGEDYLETILILYKRNGHVKSIDVAHELEYSKPSVSRAVKILRERGFITVDDQGFLWLTDEGKKTAENIYERHTVLASFLMDVAGVDKLTAYDDACRIEHVISQESFDSIKRLVKDERGQE